MFFSTFIVIMILLAIMNYYALFKGDILFTAFSFGLCIWMWVLLTGEGIQFLTQINSAGTLVFTVSKASNDNGFFMLSWLFLGVAFIHLQNILALLLFQKPLYKVGGVTETG